MERVGRRVPGRGSKGGAGDGGERVEVLGDAVRLDMVQVYAAGRAGTSCGFPARRRAGGRCGQAPAAAV
ncbi:hypothetical protein GCM10010129_81790 [Streptomyces fumigatiscleroticus]|nr:hypothetical protein GCM10010129_81790 [Streptomyces fumigatiscleroticus]